jgi:hypothetical protein
MHYPSNSPNKYTIKKIKQAKLMDLCLLRKWDPDYNSEIINTR